MCDSRSPGLTLCRSRRVGGTLRHCFAAVLVPFICAAIDAAGGFSVRVHGSFTGESASLSRNGVLSSDETWSGIVVVTGDVTVPVGVTLTILPGTTVLFVAGSDDQNGGEFPTKAELIVQGCLSAQGTATQPILFSSASEEPSPGDWGQIMFYYASPSSIVSHSQIEFATRGVFTWSTRQLTVSHNTISHNSGVGVLASVEAIVIVSNTIAGNPGDGIYLFRSASLVDGNVIANNSGIGINLAYYSSPNVTNNTISGNAGGGVLIQGGYEPSPRFNYNTITGNGAYAVNNQNACDIDATNNDWGTDDPGLIAAAIYDFNDDPEAGLVAFSTAVVAGEEHVSGAVTWSGVRLVTSHVWIDRGATLTIEAGTVVRFAGHYGIFDQGTLLVNGTSTAPVLFTPDAAIPTPGAWAMVKFNFAEGAINYARVQYAWRGLVLNSSSASIDHCSIANSLDCGVMVAFARANTSFTNSVITDNGAHGIHLFVSSPAIDNTTVSRNRGSGIWAYFYSSPVVTCSRLTHNTGDGLTVLPAGYFTDVHINYSSLYGNGGYSLRQEANQDLDATFNFWGTADETVIAERIFDHNDDPGAGVVDSSNYLKSEPICGAIQGTVDLDPDTLNLGGKGKWITAYVELPEGHSAMDIDAGKTLLEGVIPPLPQPIEIGDHDGDGVADLMLKFDRQALIQHLVERGQTSGAVSLRLTGVLKDGTPFEGSDTVRVLR